MNKAKSIVKMCKWCEKENRFTYTKNRKGVLVPRSKCVECETRCKQFWDASFPDKAKKNQHNAWLAKSARDSYGRLHNICQEKYIWKDSKGSARKHNLIHLLTVEQISHIISEGCTYCGAQNEKMTLDRIDNGIGYIVSNVRCACLRCNYMRKDMPYAAWMSLVPAIKQAYENGLFGSWTGCVRKPSVYLRLSNDDNNSGKLESNQSRHEPPSDT